MHAADAAVASLLGAAIADSDPADDLLPGVGQSAIWLIIGLLLLVAIPLYYAAVWLATRPRRPRIPKAAPAPDLGTLRVEYLARIDDVERDYAAGMLTERAANARLSALVRDFAAAATRIPADRMNLAELRRTPLTGTTWAVSQYYPAVFAPASPRPVEAGAAAAREVIARWS